MNTGEDPYRSTRSFRNEGLFPRYTWLRFFLILGAMMVLGTAVTPIFNSIFFALSLKAKTIFLTPILMVIGFLIVEVVDDVFLEWEQSLDRFRRVVTPLLAVLILIILILGIKNKEYVVSSFTDWRNSVNDKLQSKPTQVSINPEQGLNWRFNYETPSALKHLTSSEAKAYCASIGTDWQIFDGDKTFIPNPNPVFSRSFSVWYGTVAGQLDKKGIYPPSVFSSVDERSRLPALCVNKKVKQ